MRVRVSGAAALVAVAALFMHTLVAAAPQGGRGGRGGQAAPRPAAAGPTDVKQVLYDAADTLGMLREVEEEDRISSIVYGATGTMTVQGQPCKLANYKASVNYLFSGMRVDFACATPAGQPGQRQIQVVNGRFAWNETTPGVGATPAAATASERQVQIWMLPEGAVKAAVAAGANTKVTVEGGNTVLTFPLPAGLTGTEKVTLNAKHFIDRVEVRMGTTVLENAYADYGDWNGDDYLSDVLFPKHIVQKQGPVTVLDLTITKTNTYNPYVIMPVPENVEKAGTR